jgi:hypothetical protein
MPEQASLYLAALIGGALGVSYVPPAAAELISYSLTDPIGSVGAGPYGTVTVETVSSTEVFVKLVLTAGEVFAVSGAGEALMFDISGNPSISISNLTSGFASNGPDGHADGSGAWDYTNHLLILRKWHKPSD